MKYILTFIIAAILGFLGAGYVSQTHSYGNVLTQSIVPKVQTDQNVAVGPQNAVTLASTASNCTSRVISTASTSIMLSFSSSFVPAGQSGHWQAASTTQNYDNAIYGCGAITAWSAASSSVTVATFAQ